MERLLEIALTNAGYAAVLAVMAAWVERCLSGASQGEMHWPSVVRGLWLLVLLRLLMPPVFELGLTVLPAPALPVGQLSKAPGSVIPALANVGKAAPLSVSATEIAIALWLAGAFAVLTLALVRTAGLRRWLRAAEPVTAPLAARVSELARRMGISRPPEISVVDAAVPPMLWSALGSFRLILPAALLRRMSVTERDALIVHELAHLQRHDHWARYLELVAVVLFWWNPTAWWACRRLRRAEERCCDALVAETLPEHRRAYADCLLKTLRYLSGSRPAHFAVASGARELQDLERRLTMIMTHKAPKTLSPSIRTLLVAAALAFLAVFPTLAQKGTLPSQDPEFSGQPIDLDVQGKSLGKVLVSLAGVSGLNFIVEPGVDLSVPVTAKFEQVPWDQVLVTVLRDSGRDYSLEGNVIWVGPADRHSSTSRPFVGEAMDLRLDGADLRQTLQDFSKRANLDIVLAPGIEGKVTMELVGVPWDQALDAVLRINGLEMTRKGGVLEVHAPTSRNPHE